LTTFRISMVLGAVQLEVHAGFVVEDVEIDKALPDPYRYLASQPLESVALEYLVITPDFKLAPAAVREQSYHPGEQASPCQAGRCLQRLHQPTGCRQPLSHRADRGRALGVAVE